VAAPSSKSAAQRAIVTALLAQGTTVLRHLSLCDDTAAALQAAQTLGAQVSIHNDSYTITSRFFANNTANKTISVGESGLLTRMIAPIAALLDCHVTITGSGSLQMRPMNMIEDALRQFGVQISSADGHLPLSIQGNLHGGIAHIDGSGGSQLLTGLLMALPLSQEDTIIYVQNLKSTPYIDLTIDLLRHFGIVIHHTDYKEFCIQGRQHYAGCAYDVEGDWSAASCLLVAGCIAGRVSVSNLNMHSLQADIAIVDAIKRAGGIIYTENIGGRDIVITEMSPLQAFDFDASHCPDLFPALVALAACADGTSHIRGAERLLHKESNRAIALQAEFAKIGISIDIRGNDMYIVGGKITGGRVFAHNDHRIAMALATAALRATNPVNIENAECTAKSYPQFWEDFLYIKIPSQNRERPNQ
jgi:3-phosphoshikimate 1-carboxyvinyltransferase